MKKPCKNLIRKTELLPRIRIRIRNHRNRIRIKMKQIRNTGSKNTRIDSSLLGI